MNDFDSAATRKRAAFVDGFELGAAQAVSIFGPVGVVVMAAFGFPWFALVYVAATALGLLIWRRHGWAWRPVPVAADVPTPSAATQNDEAQR